MGEGTAGCPPQVSLYCQQQNALRNPLDRVSLPLTSTPNSRDCPAIPDQANSPTKQGLHYTMELCDWLYIFDAVLKKIGYALPCEGPASRRMLHVCKMFFWVMMESHQDGWNWKKKLSTTTSSSGRHEQQQRGGFLSCWPAVKGPPRERLCFGFSQFSKTLPVQVE